MSIYKVKDDQGKQILLNTDDALEKWGPKRQGGGVWVDGRELCWEETLYHTKDHWFMVINSDYIEHPTAILLTPIVAAHWNYWLEAFDMPPELQKIVEDIEDGLLDLSEHKMWMAAGDSQNAL
jgi:hypothetical protein